MSRRMWLAIALFWTAFGLISGFQVWISMITHGHSVPRLIGYYIAVWEGWFFASALIIRLGQRWPVIPPTTRSVLIHALAACAVAVAHVAYWEWLLVYLRPFDRRQDGNEDVFGALFYRFPLEITLYILVLGSSHAVEFYKQYKDRERSLTAARLHALELQLQPHFLFNTLNAISALTRNRRNDEAVAMMAGLSDLLRYTLDHAGEQRVPLEDELAVLQRYLEIQRARFPDRMTFGIDVDPGVKRAAVPVLMLQPLAENAVRHGIAPRSAPGVVEVRAFREQGRLRIDMFNTGNLPDRTDMRVGLKNTVERLEQLYGREFRFDLSNANGGVVASLSIPWSEVA
jgi:two-component system, LytTR family, sensor kinase